MDRQSFIQNGAQKYNGGRSSFSEWLSTPQGAYVLDWECAQIHSAVEDVFGFRAVQIGLPEVDFLSQNRIPFRFSLALEPGASLAADPLQLPLATQSVDLVVLPHVLESHEHPHEVLREAERVLMPEGQVVISGFNTASLWRLRQLRRAGLQQGKHEHGSRACWQGHIHYPCPIIGDAAHHHRSAEHGPDGAGWPLRAR